MNQVRIALKRTALLLLITSLVIVLPLHLHENGVCQAYRLLSAAPRSGMNPEVTALMEVKANLVDPQNETSGWDYFFTDPCTWHHVSCVNQSVTKLELGNLRLSGTISPSIGTLANLQILSLEDNNISGAIPADIGGLSHLRTLDLSNNGFTGPIPSTFGQLRNLRTLLIRNNSVSGNVPASLASIPTLGYVDISFNNLSGAMPRLSAILISAQGNKFLCGDGTVWDCPGQPQHLPLNMSEGLHSPSEHSRKVAIVAPIVFLCGVLAILLALFRLYWRNRAQNRDEELYPDVRLGQLRRFSLRELQKATNYFSSKNLLGRGGFGDVYKGMLPSYSSSLSLSATAYCGSNYFNGSSSVGSSSSSSSGTQLVAVKRMRNRNDNIVASFKVEVEMISLASHRNLLPLHGFCVSRTELLLVFPYKRNGNVASRLLEKPALDWAARKRIAMGSARGLVYLHEQCEPKIIHRDVKAANILLDDDNEAIVADFGLAKLLDHSQTHVTTDVRGTMGYIPPEYLQGKFSDKSDVYQFGILLLELLTGKVASDFWRHQGLMMLDSVKRLARERKLEELLDEELRLIMGRSAEAAAEMEQMVRVTLLCTLHLPSDRPKMSEVLRMLDGEAWEEKWQAALRRALIKEEPAHPPSAFSFTQLPPYLTSDAFHPAGAAQHLELARLEDYVYVASSDHHHHHHHQHRPPSSSSSSLELLVSNPSS